MSQFRAFLCASVPLWLCSRPARRRASLNREIDKPLLPIRLEQNREHPLPLREPLPSSHQSSLDSPLDHTHPHGLRRHPGDLDLEALADAARELARCLTLSLEPLALSRLH